MIIQMLKFGLVGALATGVHMLIGLVLIASSWPPFLANAAAFSVAFVVSFIGHLGFSFSDQDAVIMSAAWRFGLTALAGFSANEAFLMMLLRHAALPGTVAICLSTASAAILTFALSKLWAFRHRDAATKDYPDFCLHYPTKGHFDV